MPVPHPILKVKHVALRCFSKYSVSSKSCCISQLLQPRSYFISLLNQWRRKGERSLSASCLSVDESSKAKAFTHPIQLWRHQVKLRYKFSHTSSDSSFEKHSRAYFPSHFALLNYPAREGDEYSEWLLLYRWIYFSCSAFTSGFLSLSPSPTFVEENFERLLPRDWLHDSLRKKDSRILDVWKGFDVRCTWRWMK